MIRFTALIEIIYILLGKRTVVSLIITRLLRALHAVQLRPRAVRPAPAPARRVIRRDQLCEQLLRGREVLPQLPALHQQPPRRVLQLAQPRHAAGLGKILSHYGEKY